MAKIISFMEWYIYDGGKSIGKKGSENGIIVDDIESHYGARITLEKDGVTAPFSVTFGIYGLLFHTRFAERENEARDYINLTKEKIKGIYTHGEIPENERDDAWINRYNELLSSLMD